MDMRVFWSSPDKNPFTRNARPYGIRHRKQRHKGGYEHEDRAFDHFEFVLPVNLRYGNSVGSAADDFDRNSKSGAKRGYRKRSPSGEREKKGAAEGGVTKLPETSPAEVPAFALPYVVNALPMSTAATGYRSMAGAGR